MPVKPQPVGRGPTKLCSTTLCYGTAVVFDPKHLCAKCLKARDSKTTKEEVEKEDGDEGTDPGQGS